MEYQGLQASMVGDAEKMGLLQSMKVMQGFIEQGKYKEAKVMSVSINKKLTQINKGGF